MGLHEHAWSGLNIMIYGKTPMMPMRIEQSIARASPTNEIRVTSYEDYEQGYDFSKDVKNVGLILIEENTGDIAPGDCFKELAALYQQQGWPCFGVLIYNDQETFLGYRTIHNDSRFIDYCSADEFTNPAKIYETLSRLWGRFVKTFEQEIIPQSLQNTLLGLASTTRPLQSHLFSTRTSNLLTHNLNLSWLDQISIDWGDTLRAVYTSHPQALEEHSTLLKISEISKYSLPTSDLIGAIQSKASLPARVLEVTRLLNLSRENGTLESILKDAATYNKPGSPALIKRIVTSGAAILKFSQEVTSTSTNELRRIAA